MAFMWSAREKHKCAVSSVRSSVIKTVSRKLDAGTMEVSGSGRQTEAGKRAIGAAASLRMKRFLGRLESRG